MFDLVIASVRAVARHPLPADITRDASLILDLGFDSMSVARLALALEDQLHQPILLDDWIARETDAATLTVDSLCRYLDEALGANEHSTL
jgi:acyl carrier protein